MRSRAQIEKDTVPLEGAMVVSPQTLLKLILEALLDIRFQLNSKDNR